MVSFYIVTWSKYNGVNSARYFFRVVRLASHKCYRWFSKYGTVSFSLGNTPLLYCHVRFSTLLLTPYLVHRSTELLNLPFMAYFSPYSALKAAEIIIFNDNSKTHNLIQIFVLIRSIDPSKVISSHFFPPSYLFCNETMFVWVMFWKATLSGLQKRWQTRPMFTPI